MKEVSIKEKTDSWLREYANDNSKAINKVGRGYLLKACDMIGNVEEELYMREFRIEEEDGKVILSIQSEDYFSLNLDYYGFFEAMKYSKIAITSCTLLLHTTPVV